MLNRYVSRARISERKFRHILRLFALDLNAVQIADLTRLSRVPINRYLTALRAHGMALRTDRADARRD